MDSEGWFSQAGLNTNRIKKRELVRPHTEGRTRNTHAVWPVTDASDRADVDMDELLTLTDLGERGDRHGGDGMRVGGIADFNEN